MGAVNWKDAGIRALKTFVQAAVPLALTVPSLVAQGHWSDAGSALVVAGLAGAAAVIAFAWNVLLDWSRK